MIAKTVGTSIPANRIEVTEQSGYTWVTAFDGHATEESLREWINRFNQSILGGHNSHLGAGGLVVSAKVIAQTGSCRGEVLVSIEGTQIGKRTISELNRHADAGRAWDQQMDRDANAGKLDKLRDEALAEQLLVGKN